MARRKKGGGRVTPPGTRPGGHLRLVNDIPDELLEALPTFDDGLAIYRDAQASFFALTLAPETFDEIDLRSEPDAPTAAMVIEALTSFGPRLPQRVIDALAVLTVYGDATDLAERELDRLEPPPSARTRAFGSAEVTNTTKVTDVFGEATQYVFELRYPDGSSGVVAVLIDHLMGGLLRDAIVFDDIDEFAELVNDTGDLIYEPVDVAEAAAHVDAAIAFTDRTLVAEDVVSDDALGLRPMIERFLAPVPRRPREHTPMPYEERQALVQEFSHWARGEDPDADDDVLDWARLAVDFAADEGTGDPLKWGPNSIISFLEWSTCDMLATPDELRQIPHMLRIFVPWAHQRMGWNDDHLLAALDAIDRGEPIFEHAITSGENLSPNQQLLQSILESVDFDDPEAVRAAIEGYNASIGRSPFGRSSLSTAPIDTEWTTVQPTGGVHPEAFDGSGLGSAAPRATQIADLASVAARAVFDDEYVTLVRRVIADAAAAEPSLFGRGKVDIWASGAVYAVAQINGLIDGWGAIALSSTELTSRLAGAPGTIQSKAREIRDALGVDRWTPAPHYQHTRAHYDPYSDDAYFGASFDDVDDGFGTPPLRLGPPRPGPTFVLRCQLDELDVWRTVTVPSAITLSELHVVMQNLFEWVDYHLHEFTIGDHWYAPDPELDEYRDGGIDDRDVRLGTLVKPGDSFEYRYDFGDDWRVGIAVLDQLDPDPGRPPVDLLDGAGDAPPEDCGGVWGYRHLVEVLADPRHPEHDELARWAGGFEPGTFDANHAAVRLRANVRR